MSLRFTSNPVFWGCLLTSAVFAFGWWGAFQPACFETNAGFTTCPTKWFYLWQSTPNELGDTLAGFAGALAFIWIVVTVILQGRELAAQREELTLTRREFTKMASAQKKQVELLVAQGEIFKDEQRQRKEATYDALAEELLKNIWDSRGDLYQLRWSEGEKEVSR